MNASIDRRTFLAGSAGLAAAALLPRTAGADATKQTIALGSRDGHLRLTGKKDSWSALEAIGAEVVEATIGEDLSLPVLFHPDRKYTAATDAGVEALLADMKASGKRISAFCMYNRFEARPEFEVQWGAKVARAAKALGVKAIRIDVVPHKMAAPEFLELSVKTLKQLIEATEGTGVPFAIENHGGTTNNPDFLKPLLDRVGSKRLGLTLDIGNFYWYGHPLSKIYEICEMFAPSVFHTHCKSIRYPESEREKRRTMGWQYGKFTCPVYEGDVDYRRVVKILRAAGYANDLCVEDESLGKFPAAERGEVLAKEIRYLKECLA
jgi:sugar phosphate isomerase/epimerase